MEQETYFQARTASLGETLVEVGVITPSQLEQALKECGGNQKDLGDVLVRMGFVTQEKITKALSIRLGIPYLLSLEGMVEEEAVILVPEALARRLLVIPLYRSEDSLTLGMVDPLNINAIDEVSRYTGLRVRPIIATLEQLLGAIETAYGRVSKNQPKPTRGAKPANDSPKWKMKKGEQTEINAEPSKKTASPKEGAVSPKVKASQEGAQAGPTDSKVRVQVQEESAIEMVTAIVQEGLARRASDIHIELAEKIVRVRYRIDGMLHDGRMIDKESESAVIARIKILSKLDITETRLPQDGHFRFDYAGKPIDVRVSVLPAIFGEKCVMRLLDSSKNIKQLGDLGLSAPNQKSFTEAIHRPNGIVLVTGPTGSGKTTTLYAALCALNDSTRNITTLEDPVEYRIDRMNQVEVQPKIGFTFAAGLRSVLRQDPNVVLVGEIRDQETAEIAIQAAGTGHLVFSTLHTNDAVSAIHRLIHLHIEPFLLAANLRGVMAQRLVRRLCDKCKRPHILTDAEKEALQKYIQPGDSFFEPVGCEGCQNLGYGGRLAVHEWLAVGRGLRDLILKRGSVDDMKDCAEKEGMFTLQKDALGKAAQGHTSLAEVIRVSREDSEGGGGH